jgi:hypothetical protein
MAISMRCPECGRKLNAPDTAAGKRARCPHCKAIVTLPHAGEAQQDEILDAEPVAAEPPPLGVAPQAPPAYPSAPPDFPMSDEIPMAPVAPPPLGPDATQPRKPCPMCGEMIPINAVQCRFCHEIFDPALKKAQAKHIARGRGGAGDDDMSAGEWVVAILCSGIGCICGIIWMIQGKPKGKKMFGVSLLFTVLWSVIRGILESSQR